MFTSSQQSKDKSLKTSDKAIELFSCLSLKDKVVCFNPQWTKYLYTKDIKNIDFFKTIYQNSENKILFDLCELLINSTEEVFVAYLKTEKSFYDDMRYSPYRPAEVPNRFFDDTLYRITNNLSSGNFLGSKKIEKASKDVNEYIGDIKTISAIEFENNKIHNFNLYYDQTLYDSDKKEILHYQNIPICYIDYKKIHKQIKGHSMCTRFFLWKENGEPENDEFYRMFKNVDIESVNFIEDFINGLYKGAITLDLEDKVEYMYKSKSFTKESKMSNWGGRAVEVLVFNSLESLFAYELYNLKGLKRCKNCKKQLPKKYKGIYCRDGDNHPCCVDRSLKRKHKSLGV